MIRILATWSIMAAMCLRVSSQDLPRYTKLNFKTTELMVGYTNVPVKKLEKISRACAMIGISVHRHPYYARRLDQRYNLAVLYAPDVNALGAEVSTELNLVVLNFRPSVNYYYKHGSIESINFSPRLGLGYNLPGGGLSVHWSPQINLLNNSTVPLQWSNFVFTMYFF